MTPLVEIRTVDLKKYGKHVFFNSSNYIRYPETRQFLIVLLLKSIPVGSSKNDARIPHW